MPAKPKSSHLSSAALKTNHQNMGSSPGHAAWLHPRSQRPAWTSPPRVGFLLTPLCMETYSTRMETYIGRYLCLYPSIPPSSHPSMYACTYTNTYTCMGTCTCMETQTRTQTYTYTDIQIQAHACRHRVGVGLKRQRSVTVRKYVWRSAAVSALYLYSSRRCSKAWVRAGFWAPLDLEYATSVKQGPIVTISDSASVTLNLKNTCSDTLHSHPCLQLHLLWSCRPHPPLLKLLCVTSYFTSTHLCMYETCARVCCACLGDSVSSLFNPATSSKPEPASRSPGTRMFCEFHALSTPWPGCNGRILFHKPRTEARLTLRSSRPSEAGPGNRQLLLRGGGHKTPVPQLVGTQDLEGHSDLKSMGTASTFRPKAY